MNVYAYITIVQKNLLEKFKMRISHFLKVIRKGLKYSPIGLFYISFQLFQKIKNVRKKFPFINYSKKTISRKKCSRKISIITIFHIKKKIQNTNYLKSMKKIVFQVYFLIFGRRP